MPGPQLGLPALDPALAAVQPVASSPVDPIAAAIAALQASGAQFAAASPSLFATDPHDTDLEALPPRERTVDMEPSFPTAQYDATGRQIHGVQLPEGSVTVTGQQPMPSPREAAMRTRQEQVADPSVPLATDDVAGYTARENQALGNARETAGTAAMADFDAARALAERTAQANEKAAGDLQQDAALYRNARAAAEAKADADTAMWLQQYQDMAQREPNPHRWWDNTSTLGKALWGLGLIFGAANVALTPGAKNVVLGMVQDNIRQDMAEQRERLQREMEGMKLRGQVIDRQNQRNLTDLTDDHTMELGRLNALRQAYIARAAAPGAADLQAGLAHADQWFAEQSLKTATARRETAVQAEHARLDRQLRWSMQSREIAKDYDLANLSAGVQLAAQDKGQDPHKDQIRISPETGAMVVDKKTGRPIGDGALYVDKAMEPAKVQAIITAANQEAADLATLRHALADESSFMGFVTGTNVEAQQALARIQKSAVAGEGGLGHTTDRDMATVTQSILGLGTADIYDRTRLAAKQASALKALDSVINNQQLAVNNKLSTYSPEGARIDWSPRNVVAPEQRPLTPDEQVAQLGGQVAPKAAPTSPEQLRDMRARGEDPRLTGPAAAGQYAPVLQNLEQSLKGSSPAHIRQLAEAAIEAVTPRQPDPWNPDVAIGDAKKKPNQGSEFAEKAYIPDVVEPVLKDAEAREKKLVRDLANEAMGKGFKAQLGVSPTDRWKSHAPVMPSRQEVKEYAATEYGFTNLSPEDLDHLMDEVDAALGRKRKN